jgi:hypothetical protein
MGEPYITLYMNNVTSTMLQLQELSDKMITKFQHFQLYSQELDDDIIQLLANAISIFLISDNEIDEYNKVRNTVDVVRDQRLLVNLHYYLTLTISAVSLINHLLNIIIESKIESRASSKTFVSPSDCSGYMDSPLV